jgi:hypothetical protein
MNENLSFRETVYAITDIRRADVDMEKVLSKVVPNHAHFFDELLINGERFNPIPDFVKWCEKQPYDLVPTGRSRAMAMLERYFTAMGAYGTAYHSWFDFFNFDNLATELSSSSLRTPWNPQTAELFSQIDFQIHFYLKNFPRHRPYNLNFMHDLYIELETNMIKAPIFRPHAIGYPDVKATDKPSMEVKTIVHGNGYIKRIDDMARSNGVTEGVDAIYVNNDGMDIIRAFQEARVERLTT